MLIPDLAKDSLGEEVLFWGNEALARGAIEAGVNIVSSYPGTPASEIMESILKVAKNFNIYAEWSTNEKVAIEVAIGAAIAGQRSLVSMKSVGLNWAVDPLMSLNQTGIIGGMVIITADDPSAHSSQNEQDNRFYAVFAELPMFEPSEPQEAKDMVVAAFDLSEKLELPVMIRSVTRLSHSRGNVILGNIDKTIRKAKFINDPHRWVMIPSWSLHRHKWLHDKQDKIRELTTKLPFDHLNLSGKDLGILGCGLASNYALDALKILGIDDRISFLKIGVVNPVCLPKIQSFLKRVDKVLVIEENEPFLENKLKEIAYDIKVNTTIYGRLTGHLPREWELNTDIVTSAISRILDLGYNDSNKKLLKLQIKIPPRSIVMCPGCPHRATFYAIKKAIKNPIITGDIGCFALGALPPLNMQHTCFCMGASIGVGIGLSKTGIEKPIIATLGDSTFFHAGMPALVDAVFNKANITIVVMDNQTIAMTGFQESITSGKNAMGEETYAVKIEEVAKAFGVEYIKVIDPFRLKDAIKIIRSAVEFEGPSIIVSRRLCSLLKNKKDRIEGKKKYTYTVNFDSCNACKICINDFGCPAIIWDIENEKATVESTLCVGCGVCTEVCPFEAFIIRED